MPVNGKPILPANPKAPTMTLGINNDADRSIKRAMRRIQNSVLTMLNDTPKERVAADMGGIIGNADSVYLYQISAPILTQMPSEIGDIINQQLMESGRLDWYMYDAVDKAEETGLAAEVVNIQAQTTSIEYPVTVQAAMLAPAHQARVELARSRVFEEMQMLSAEMKANLSRVLATGMQNGDSPRKIARRIYDTIGLPEWNDGGDKASYARALRIARTEINEAHRSAREGEHKQAQQLGIKLGRLWLSALLPTTRRTHASKHGKVFTQQEVNDFYSRDGNSINCRCSQSSVVLDEDGQPRSSKIIKQTQDQRKRYLGEEE